MPLLPNPSTPITYQQFLDMMDRLLPAHYIEPLKSGQGYEVFQAYARMFAAISQGVADTGADAQIATAGDGSFATGTVQLYRGDLPSSGQALVGQTGDSASIVTGAAPLHMRVTGLTNMSAASVGHFLVLTNTAYPFNSGGFLITQYNDTSSVDVSNPVAIVPDTNNGTIGWTEEDRTVVVKANTVVTTSIGGRDFITMADQTFMPLDLGPFTVPIQSVAKGYEYNVPGQVIAADGEVLAGAVDTVKTLREIPDMGDLSIKVRQLVATTGGADGTLGSIGDDRGIIRLDGEPVDTYRIRIRSLPDTISPDAIYRTVLDLLRPVMADFTIIETWAMAYCTCWDGPAGQIDMSNYNPDLLAYDNPSTIPFQARWLDENDHRGGIIVVAPGIQPLADYGTCWDDTAVSSSELVSTVSKGRRASGAWDIHNTYIKAYQCAWDGLDYKKNSLYLGIYDTLQAIKSAGVSAAVELEGA
jgi:hypothetical protein